jgi:hypothetical protein
MTPKLRAVTEKPAPIKRFTVRPLWAHPTNEKNRDAYVSAIKYLRKGGRSKWKMDQPAQRLTKGTA